MVLVLVTSVLVLAIVALVLVFHIGVGAGVGVVGADVCRVGSCALVLVASFTLVMGDREQTERNQVRRVVGSGHNGAK